MSLLLPQLIGPLLNQAELDTRFWVHLSLGWEISSDVVWRDMGHPLFYVCGAAPSPSPFLARVSWNLRFVGHSSVNGQRERRTGVMAYVPNWELGSGSGPREVTSMSKQTTIEQAWDRCRRCVRLDLFELGAEPLCNRMNACNELENGRILNCKPMFIWNLVCF